MLIFNFSTIFATAHLHLYTSIIDNTKETRLTLTVQEIFTRCFSAELHLVGTNDVYKFTLSKEIEDLTCLDCYSDFNIGVYKVDVDIPLLRHKMAQLKIKLGKKTYCMNISLTNMWLAKPGLLFAMSFLCEEIIYDCDLECKNLIQLNKTLIKKSRERLEESDFNNSNIYEIMGRLNMLDEEVVQLFVKAQELKAISMNFQYVRDIDFSEKSFCDRSGYVEDMLLDDIHNNLRALEKIFDECTEIIVECTCLHYENLKFNILKYTHSNIGDMEFTEAGSSICSNHSNRHSFDYYSNQNGNNELDIEPQFCSTSNKSDNALKNVLKNRIRSRSEHDITYLKRDRFLARDVEIFSNGQANYRVKRDLTTENRDKYTNNCNRIKVPEFSSVDFKNNVCKCVSDKSENADIGNSSPASTRSGRYDHEEQAILSDCQVNSPCFAELNPSSKNEAIQTNECVLINNESQTEKIKVTEGSCQTDKIGRIVVSTQTDTKIFVDKSCQTDNIKTINNSTQTDKQLQADGSCQTCKTLFVDMSSQTENPIYLEKINIRENIGQINDTNTNMERDRRGAQEHSHQKCLSLFDSKTGLTEHQTGSLSISEFPNVVNKEFYKQREELEDASTLLDIKSSFYTKFCTFIKKFCLKKIRKKLYTETSRSVNDKTTRRLRKSKPREAKSPAQTFYTEELTGEVEEEENLGAIQYCQLILFLSWLLFFYMIFDLIT